MKILSILKKFSTPIIFLAVVTGLFLYYNIFLIDRTLEDLRFSLSQTALAYDIKDIDGLDIILTKTLTTELSPLQLNSYNMLNLEFVRGIAREGKSYQQLDYARAALDAVIKKKEDKRGWLFTILDSINSFFKKGLKYITHLPQYLKKRKIKPLEEAGIQLFEQARELEKENKLPEAVARYRDFIEKYPDSEKTALANLRLAYTYHRMNQFDQARALYNEIINTYFAERESDIAQALLFQLNQKDNLIARMNLLLAKAGELPAEDTKAKQEAYYELGIINTQLLNFEEAKKFFKRASNTLPESEVGLKSLFNSAWTSKQVNALTESIADFTKLTKDKTIPALMLDSSYQLADIYHRQGYYREAIEVLSKLSEGHKDDPLTALCLFQVGASYMYDLNDDQKAREVFARLTKEYADSPYARYLAPENPVGIFVTYLVPRASRVVSWRAGGLLALSGYSGEIAKFKIKVEEKAFNNTFNNWLKAELPDTVGNLYVDVKGTEVEFLKDKAKGTGRITMGKFNVEGDAEGHLELDEEGGLNLIITKAFLEKIPIPPLLINNAIRGISLIGRKYFPIIVSNISMEKGEITVEGYGSKRMLSRIENVAKKAMGIEKEFREIKDPGKQKEVYDLFKERFPESAFSPLPRADSESLFLDFFTRMYFYLSFKLLETVKDSKLDYERSIRSLGRLLIKKIKFKVTYQEADINSSLNRLINIEFPWIANGEFLFDIKGLEFDFRDNQEIGFKSIVKLGNVHFPVRLDETKELSVDGSVVLEIDQESKLPRFRFKEVFLNGKPFPLEKLNLVTLRCLGLLKDTNIPLQLEEVKVFDNGISLKGEGARDFLNNVFSDPHLFVIFQIRTPDLQAAGIQRLKDRPQDTGDYWRGEVEPARPEGELKFPPQPYQPYRQ